MGWKPRAVFLNRFYWPDVAATGQMLADLAEDLAARGWKVTVVTSRGVYADAAASHPARETHNGVDVVRVATTRFGRGTIIGRIGDYLSYFAGSFVQLLRLPKPDLVVAMTDPPLLLAPVLAAGAMRGFRTVYWVQDLYPQLAAKLGVMREGGFAYGLFSAIGRRLNRGADAVVALGPQMARAMVDAGARPERTAVVHNWSDASAVRPVPPEDNPFLAEHGLLGKFVVLYSGNAGRAHTFEAVSEAMRRLRDEAGVVFVFIGGGPKLGEIRAAAERDALPNVRFMDYLPRAELAFSLSAASAALVTESPDVVGMLVPSKTYGILASGRPLIFVGAPESDVASVVRDADCGLVVSPDDPQGLVDAILALRDDPQRAAELGRRARLAAENLYDRRHATAAWAREVERLLRGTVDGETRPEAASVSTPSGPVRSAASAGSSECTPSGLVGDAADVEPRRPAGYVAADADV